MKQQEDKTEKGIRIFLSWLNNPGATNRQIWEKITGHDNSSPQTSASFR